MLVDQLEQVLLAVVVAELPCVAVERELGWAHAVMFEEFRLGVAPEAFEPVDVHLAAAEVARVVEPEVPVAVEGERVVARPPVRVDQRAALNAGLSAAARRLAGLDEMDCRREISYRLERQPLRELLLGTRERGSCALCGGECEASLRVAAHVKRRADSNHEERRAVGKHVIWLCALGCDALFERGTWPASEEFG